MKKSTIKFSFRDNDYLFEDEFLVINDDIWLSKLQLANLYERDRTTISRQIKSIYEKSLLDKETTCANFACNKDKTSKSIDYYSSEVLLLIGARIKSTRGQLFYNCFRLNYSKENNNEMQESIIYNNGNVSIDVKISPLEETVWLTQNQIAELFETTRPNVSTHIKNIVKEGELSVGKDYLPTGKNRGDSSQKESSSKDLIFTSKDGKHYVVTYYNLDMILAIGYRVKGDRAIQFRKWASSVLKQYLMKGYAIDKERSIVTYQNFIKLEEEVEDMKGEIKDIKEKMFIEPVKERLFFNGEFFDAYEFICSLVGSANKRVTIIDPYFDLRALSILEKTKPDVQRLVYCTFPSSINKRDKKEFRKQYGYLDFFVLKGFHDRFIILDESICYSIGTSLNSVGRNTFAVNKIEDIGITKAIIKRIGQCLFHEE